MNCFLKNAITFDLFLSFLWVLNKFLFSSKECFLNRNRSRWWAKSGGFGGWTRFGVIFWFWFFCNRQNWNFRWFYLWATKLTVGSFKTRINQLLGKIVELINIRISFGSIGFISINLFKFKNILSVWLKGIYKEHSNLEFLELFLIHLMKRTWFFWIF